MLVGNLLYEKSNVSKIVKKLKELEYIEVSRSNKDGRVSHIELMEKGEFVWEQCIKKFQTWNREWIKPLTKDELKLVLRIHDRLMGSLQDGLG